MPEVDETTPVVEKGNPGKVILFVLCIFLSVGLIAQHLILSGKIHQLEEDRL